MVVDGVLSVGLFIGFRGRVCGARVWLCDMVDNELCGHGNGGVGDRSAGERTLPFKRGAVIVVDWHDGGRGVVVVIEVGEVHVGV